MPAKKKAALTKSSTTVTGVDSALVSDLRQIILGAREQVARAVDSGLVLLYWSIGNRVRTDILKEKRAAYGKAAFWEGKSSSVMVSYFFRFSMPRRLASIIIVPHILVKVGINSERSQKKKRHWRS